MNCNKNIFTVTVSVESQNVLLNFNQKKMHQHNQQIVVDSEGEGDTPGSVKNINKRWST